MQSFTYGSPDAIAAAVENARRLPDGKYPMQLNRHDLETVLTALHAYQENTPEYPDDPEDVATNAGALYTDILSTLDVEVI